MAEVPVPATTAEKEEALLVRDLPKGRDIFEVPGPVSSDTAHGPADSCYGVTYLCAQSSQVTGSGVSTFGPDAMPAFMAEMLR